MNTAHLATPAEIAPLVAQFYGVGLRELRGSGRGKSVVRARHVFAYLAMRLTHCSDTEVGEVARLERTTVFYAVRKIASSIPNDLELNNQIQYLTRQIRSIG